MKKALITILTLSMICSLLGCYSLPADTSGADTQSTHPSTQADQQTDGATEPDITVRQQEMAAVSSPFFTKTTFAADETAIFRQTVQNIALIVPEPEAANKIIVDFLDRTDIDEQAAAVAVSAEQAYNSAPQAFSPYWASLTYEPVRIDSGVLSMFGAYAAYTGAAHAEYIFKSVSYDLTSGDVLTLEKILSQPNSIDSITQLTLDALEPQKDAKQLFDGYENTVLDHFAKGAEQITDWYFSNTGLCFFFSPYEIGPFSSGQIVAQIPYSKLAGIMNDAYFPAERETAAGGIQAELFDDAALDRFTQFADVTLNDGGKKILLSTDGLVYDIRIETGTWSANGASFTPEHTVFAAYSLTPGDGVMVDAPFTATLPNIRLSYTTNDQTVYYYITATDTTVTLTQG